MPYFITDSKTPLLMETVPVLKVMHYYGNAKRDNVYTYMRCYAHNEELYCNFTCFDECPDDGSRIAVTLQHLSGENILNIVAGKYIPVSGSIINEHNTNNCIDSSYIQQSAVITGSDEQGIYWSVNFKICKQAFKKAFSINLKSNTVFSGNLFLYSLTENAFGSAFSVPEGELALTQKGADSFIIVPY